VSVTAFIGDEITAAGYRLCGVDVYIADRVNALLLIKQACESASLVLVSSSTAQYLTTEERAVLMERITPAVVVVPDVTAKQAVPDIATMIHKQLGMLE
jgi:vacuolar-type H+-ATPase subunit F/Vma7